MALWDWIELAHEYLFWLTYKNNGDREIQLDFETTLVDLEAAMQEKDIIKCVSIIGKVFGSIKE